MAEDLEKLLDELKFVAEDKEVIRSEHILYEDLLTLSKEDMTNMKLKTGPRIRLLKWISKQIDMDTD